MMVVARSHPAMRRNVHDGTNQLIAEDAVNDLDRAGELLRS